MFATGFALGLESVSTTSFNRGPPPQTCSQPSNTQGLSPSTCRRSCPWATYWDGTTWGYLRPPPLQINRLGVIIPKGHNTGKWRLITDLSFPWHCVRSTTLQWRTPRKLSQKWPMGTLLAKFGIESAYRRIPVHPPRLPPSSKALGRQDLYWSHLV